MSSPKVGDVMVFRAVGMEIVMLLVRENRHGSFDVLDLENGHVTEYWKDPKEGTGVGQWKRLT